MAAGFENVAFFFVPALTIEQFASLFLSFVHKQKHMRASAVFPMAVETIMQIQIKFI